MPNADEVEWRLLNAADQFAKRVGVRLSEDARSFLRDRIANATARLAAEGQLNDEASLQRAERAVSSLIYRSATGGWEDRSREPSRRPRPEVREADLARTLAGLCPGFFPFC